MQLIVRSSHPCGMYPIAKLVFNGPLLGEYTYKLIVIIHFQQSLLVTALNHSISKIEIVGFDKIYHPSTC